MSADAAPPRFCRFRPDADAGSPIYSRVPDDGMCLSAFVLLHPPGGRGRVLVGRVEPSPRWARAGNLTLERARVASAGWMLPSSHLELFEGPDAAGRRIVTEQLGLPDLPLPPPRVVSEAYRREGSARDPHWDLSFLFEAEWPGARPLSHPLWKELALVEVARTPADRFVRGHGDILGLAGLAPAGSEEV